MDSSERGLTYRRSGCWRFLFGFRGSTNNSHQASWELKQRAEKQPINKVQPDDSRQRYDAKNATSHLLDEPSGPQVFVCERGEIKAGSLHRLNDTYLSSSSSSLPGDAEIFITCMRSSLWQLVLIGLSCSPALIDHIDCLFFSKSVMRWGTLLRFLPASLMLKVKSSVTEPSGAAGRYFVLLSSTPAKKMFECSGRVSEGRQWFCCDQSHHFVFHKKQTGKG